MYLQVFLIGLALLAILAACLYVVHRYPVRVRSLAASIPPAVRAATLTASSHLLGVLATHAHTFVATFGPEIVAAFADGQLDAAERVNLERIVVTFLRSKLAPALLVEIEAMLGDEFEPWLLTQFRDQLVRITGRTTVPSTPPPGARTAIPNDSPGYALHRVLLSLAIVTLVGVPLASLLTGCTSHTWDVNARAGINGLATGLHAWDHQIAIRLEREGTAATREQYPAVERHYLPLRDELHVGGDALHGAEDLVVRTQAGLATPCEALPLLQSTRDRMNRTLSLFQADRAFTIEPAFLVGATAFSLATSQLGTLCQEPATR